MALVVLSVVEQRLDAVRAVLAGATVTEVAAARQRWIAEITVGYDGRGKRIVRKASGRTKTEAKNKLRDMLRDQADGLLPVAAHAYTVGQAVEDWLTYGLANRDPATQKTNRHLCDSHVLPLLGARNCGI